MSTIGKYGRFLEQEGCFELTAEPPRKWLNVHCNEIGDEEIYAECSNLSDGPVRVRDKDGVECLLVSYDCKHIYIRDEDSGTVFCPAGAPAPQAVTDYSCRYYPSQTVITGTCQDLKAVYRSFVPRKYPIEVWTLRLENLSDKSRNVSVFAYAMFQLTGRDKEGKGIGKENFAVVHPEIGGVFVTNRNSFCPNNRFKGYLVALKDFFNGNGYRDHFLRSEFSVGTPRILWGWNCDGRPGFGPDCAGVVQVKLKIAPKAEGRADFLLGQASCIGDVKIIRSEFSPELIDKYCQEQMDIERKRAGMFKVRTGNANYDALMNTFVKKQMYSYLINKSGFRDNLQTDQALAMADYKTAEANFLRALASQYANGSVPHGFRPLNRLQYSDKPAWILMVAPNLMKESGDLGLLEKKVPFFESSETGSVWQHILRAVKYLTSDLGAHGLCDQRHADWNDGLEATKEAGARQSVMVTQQLCYGLLEVEELARRIGDSKAQAEARGLYDTFKTSLNDIAWDGQWYVRTICGDGYRIGSHANKEGKIFINSQSWAVLSQTADGDRATTCMDNLEKLLGTPMGYKLCDPGFSQYDPRVGRMSNSMPGNVENGGVYNHAAGFKAVADCMLGRAEIAWQTFVKVAPDNPANPTSQSQCEPFSFTNSYSQVPYIFGQGGYAWRTGTAGWFAVLLVEWILGARRHYDGLMIDPCLTATIKQAGATRTFRGAVYDISLDNSAGRCKGASSITVDGKKIQGNMLPVFQDGVHKVEVVI
ncbi:MAG: hypothetical protein HZA50_02685 [Planctomycetes bacterium]|nr:hypothetical protein [Planctomycetota bacterium]